MRKALTLGQQARTIASLAEALAHEADAFEDARELRLVGSQEAAAILGVSKYQMRMMRRARKLPPAAVELACGPVWRTEDIEAYARQLQGIAA